MVARLLYILRLVLLLKEQGRRAEREGWWWP